MLLSLADHVKRRVSIPRHELPLDLLVSHHDPKKFPRHTLATEADHIRLRRDADWASKREQIFATAAAGVHVALFAWNLAFWGFEGMPHDRSVREAWKSCCKLMEIVLGTLDFSYKYASEQPCIV